jgi:hypothetical protein
MEPFLSLVFIPDQAGKFGGTTFDNYYIISQAYTIAYLHPAFRYTVVSHIMISCLLEIYLHHRREIVR